MRSFVTIAIVLAGVASAQGADLVISDEVLVDETVSTGIAGMVELGAYVQHVSNESDPFDGFAPGAYVSGAISGGQDSFVWSLDGFAEFAGFETSNEAPKLSALIGAHLGTTMDAGMIGGFVSVGLAPNRDDEVDFGGTVGVEGLVDLGTGVSLFGQLGYAYIDTETGNGSAGMIGPFGRAGLVFDVSEDLALMADVGAGFAENFSDEDDEGYYVAAGVKAAFRLPVDFDAFLTAGYEAAYYNAVGDGDAAQVHTVRIGLAISFDGGSAAGVLNPLATSASPYRAAAYGSALD